MASVGGSQGQYIAVLLQLGQVRGEAHAEVRVHGAEAVLRDGLVVDELNHP